MSEINISLPAKVKMSKNQMLNNCLQAGFLELLMCYFQLQIYTTKTLDISSKRYKVWKFWSFSATYWQKLTFSRNANPYILCGVLARMCVPNGKSISQTEAEIFEVKEKHVLAARGATYVSKLLKIAQQLDLIGV